MNFTECNCFLFIAACSRDRSDCLGRCDGIIEPDYSQLRHFHGSVFINVFSVLENEF